MRLADFVPLVVPLVALAGCFNPDQPMCTYRCESALGNDSRCPTDYECRDDDYCHLKGSTGACGFAVPDLGAQAADLVASPDISMADDLPFPADMRTVYDITMPTCTDKVKNGDETDVDCGGGTCPACAAGQACVNPSDCQSGACAMGKCAPPPDAAPDATRD